MNAITFLLPVRTTPPKWNGYFASSVRIRLVKVMKAVLSGRWAPWQLQVVAADLAGNRVSLYLTLGA
jgi:hypothetical protein